MANGNEAVQLTAEVRAEIARQQLPLTVLAERVGWSLSKLQRRLSGRAPFDVAELAQVAGALGITVKDLVDRAAMQGVTQ